MALDGEGGGGIPATMLVGPTGVGNNAMPYPYPVFGGMGMGGGSGMGGFGNDGGWIVLLLIIILVAAGGWGNNGNGGGAFSGQPIVINDGGGYGSVQRGFDQAAVMSGINALTSNVCNGFADVQQSLCNGFAGVNSTVSNGFAQAEIAENARQMANMQQMFNLSTQFADCCCKNQLATESLRATVLSENCADRYEAANNTRDIIDSQTRGTQAILDKLCALELDNYKRENDNLRTQLNMSALRESQTAQTAQILAGQTAEVDALYNRLSQCPIPAEPVYGRQAIFTCPNNNSGCGCGCGNNVGGFNGNF